MQTSLRPRLPLVDQGNPKVLLGFTRSIPIQQHCSCIVPRRIAGRGCHGADSRTTKRCRGRTDSRRWSTSGGTGPVRLCDSRRLCHGGFGTIEFRGLGGPRRAEVHVILDRVLCDTWMAPSAPLPLFLPLVVLAANPAACVCVCSLVDDRKRHRLGHPISVWQASLARPPRRNEFSARCRCAGPPRARAELQPASHIQEGAAARSRGDREIRRVDGRPRRARVRG